MSAPPPTPRVFSPAFGLAITPEWQTIRRWNSAFHKRKRFAPHTMVKELDDGRFVHYYRADNFSVRSGLWLPGVEILTGDALASLTGEWIYGPEVGLAKAPKWLLDEIGHPVRDELCLSRDGDVAGLTVEAVRRFPLRQRGTRNAAMVRLLCSLIGREFKAEVIKSVTLAWWWHWHREGLASRPDPGNISASLDATLARRTLKPANGVDHVARCLEIECPPLPPGITRTPYERAFAQALTVHALHRITNLGESPDGIQVTLHYLGQTMHARCGIAPNINTMVRLAAKYVSTPDRPASVIELAYRTERGWKGSASIYCLHGWLREIVEESPARSLCSLQREIVEGSAA